MTKSKKLVILLVAIIMTASVVVMTACTKEPDYSFYQSKEKYAAFSEFDSVFDIGAGTNNNGYDKYSEEVNRYTSVTPSKRQLAFNELEYYNFIHFGMNTFTGKEWGTGKDSPSKFNPKKLSTDQWAMVLKESGSKGVIITAKHHDGFALFPSDYTTYDVASSTYKDGKGDIVGELAESCRKYDLKFGVYLSPWDMHESTYGTPAYNDFFVNQLTELLTRYGDLFSVWFDGAKGEDAPDFEYDWDRYYQTIRKYQPNAAITVCGPDVRWVGNESGQARSTEWSVVPSGEADPDKIQSGSQNSVDDADRLQKEIDTEKDNGSRLILSQYDDLKWYPSEVDVSIRNGWFYHGNQKAKSLQHLLQIYMRSVGGNNSLLLNVPPNKNGLIDSKDAARLKEMGDYIKSAFANNLIDDIAIGNNVIRTSNLNTNTLKSESNKHYAFSDTDYIMDIKLKEKKSINYVVLREDLSMSQRIELFDVYVKTDTGWLRISESTNVGSRRIVAFEPGSVPASDTVRIVIKQSRNNPYLRSVGVY